MDGRKDRGSGTTHGFCIASNGHCLIEEVLCDLRVGGYGQLDETSYPSGEFLDITAALKPPCFVDDLLDDVSSTWLNSFSVSPATL